MQTFKIFCLSALTFTAFSAQALTVKDEKGEFTIDKTPERIVALEFSFVDALANVGVSPVGIADDNEKARLQPEILEIIKDYTSVGTRSQPNMEIISSLRPDLIIADKDRHSAAYDELQKIAPVLLLNSRYGSFSDILEQAQTIGDVVGKHDEMKGKINALDKELADIKAEIPSGQSAFFAASREEALSLHTQESYTGELLERLGFTVPPSTEGGKAFYDISLEQVLSLDPDWLFVAHYRDESIVKKWEKEPLWSALKIAKDPSHVVAVDSNTWARSRGLYPAKVIAGQVRDAVVKK